MADMETRLATLEEEHRRTCQNMQLHIDTLHKLMEAQGKRTDAVTDNMQAMMARFEVGGGYPGGSDAMMSGFRACFHTP
jgi:ATP-dependent Clp protease ATP-binding subunit ClpA